MFTPLEVRYEGRAAGGYQDVFGGEVLVARAAVGVQRGQRDGVLAVEPCEAVQDRHARAAQQVAVDAIQAGDFLGAVGFEGGPVEHRRLALPSKPRRFVKTLAVMRRVAVELFGDATHVDAGATQSVGAQYLGQRHARAALRRHARSAHAAAAAANNKKIEVK